MCVTRSLGVIALVCVACGCGPTETAPNASKPANGTPRTSAPSSYHFLRSNSLKPQAVEEAREALPYDVIQLVRTECYGNCPSYVVTFRRDGSATYDGRAHVDHIGRFSGSISLFDFGKLCWAIEKFGLVQLDSSQFVSNTVDHPTTALRVTKKATGTTVEVREDGLPGPVELWLVQNTIDKLASEIQWNPAPDSLIKSSDSQTLIDSVKHISLLTPNSSQLTERIRVTISDAESCARFIDAIHKIASEGDGIALRAHRS